MSTIDIFGSNGALSRVIPGYAPRQGQVEMAGAVARHIERGGRLIIEAPTGVGKSAAALAPVLVAKKRAIYATANIALSEQIVTKDFPMIARALGSKMTCALAKGINNFVCLDAVDEQASNATGELDRVCRWALDSRSGDLSELPFIPTSETNRLLVRGSDDCLRKACDRFEDCFGLKARRAAMTADVVVTNYHMLFAHLEILANGGAEGILPEADVLILDEAHKVAEIARSFVGSRVTEFGIKRALAPLAPAQASRHTREALDIALHREATRAVREIFERARRLPQGRIKRTLELAHATSTSALLRASSVYGDAIRAATDLTLPDGSLFGPMMASELASWYGRMKKRDDAKGATGYVEKLRIAGRSCRRAAFALKSADELRDTNEIVHYTEAAGDRNVAICAVPIEVGPYLSKLIWNTSSNGGTTKSGAPKTDPHFPTVIAMSATLRDGKSSFTHVQHELGAEKAETLAVESPFDFSRCMVVCDSSWPDPKDPGFAKHLTKSLEATIRVAGGRTLALFCSWRALEATYSSLAHSTGQGRSVIALGSDGTAGRFVRVLKQGDAPRTELIRQFKEDETSVLFGVESFWAGIDVPGPALSALWIEKLPFATPNDPVFDALNEKLGREAFSKYSLPKAVLQMRQGFGRLIRSMTDAGIVVIADPRIFTASYGPRFTSTLPEACVAGDFDAAREHLEEYLT